MKIDRIPKFRLFLEPLEPSAETLKKFQWAGEEIGKRHQLGGSPDFIQSEFFPSCPSCREKMVFYGQLDSLNDDFQIADCGMIYIFICFECNEVNSFIQSY